MATPANGTRRHSCAAYSERATSPGARASVAGDTPSSERAQSLEELKQWSATFATSPRRAATTSELRQWAASYTPPVAIDSKLRQWASRAKAAEGRSNAEGATSRRSSLPLGASAVGGRAVDAFCQRRWITPRRLLIKRWPYHARAPQAAARRRCMQARIVSQNGEVRGGASHQSHLGWRRAPRLLVTYEA